MDVTPLIRRDAKIIQAYKGEAFRVSNEVFTAPAILVLPAQVLEWQIATPSTLTLEDFAILAGISDQIEVLLLGTGERLVMLSAQLRRDIREKYGVTVEVMDTGAACRTYNVLMAEGRLIGAALIRA